MFAGCCIALGTGYLAMTSYILDYEKDAVKLSYELEQIAGVEFDAITSCKKLESRVKDCKYVAYVFKQRDMYVDISINIAKVLAVFAFLFFIIDLLLNSRVGKPSKNSG
jgi:hypothetical protein